MAITFKAGLIQTNVSNEMAENVAFVREQARLARDAGADFIMTPENTGLIGANRTETLRKGPDRRGARHAGRGLRASARETGAWFLLGSIHVRVPGEEQIRNRSYLIDSAGGIVASYDKIHMFDVAAGRRRELSRILDLQAGREVGAGRDAVGRARHDDLLRPALPLSLPRPGPCRRHHAVDPVVLHGADRPGALARADARAGHRDRLLRVRAGPGRHAQGLQPQDLRPFGRRRAVGRGAGRCRRREGGLRRSPRSTSPRSPRRARWCPR